MNYREFYFWLEGYLQGRLENDYISITPIVEKMNMVKSDEQKWIDDFNKYRTIKNEPIIITEDKSPE